MVNVPIYDYNQFSVYDYDHRIARALDNPHMELKKFELLLESFEEERYKDPGYAAAFLKLLPRSVARRGLSNFFAELLQSYKASPKDQKLLEKGSQEFSKTQTRRSRNPIEDLSKKKKLYHQLYEAAKRTISKGEEVGASAQLKAGSFTLINTGGFNEKVMGAVQGLTEKADRLLYAKKLGKVCYGEVNVTGTLRKARTLAYYDTGSDELFVRSNLKGKSGPALQTILHELTHRLQYKFMGGRGNKDIKDLYRLIGNESQQKLEAVEYDKNKWPKEGDVIEAEGKHYRVTGITLNRRYNYDIHIEDVHGRKLLLPLAAYLRITYKTTSFITPYAATNPEENFAEMVAFFCLNELPEDQVKMLEDIL